MRKLKETKMVRLSVENLNRLEQDRKEFEKVIGGGKWSLNDAFAEYIKILNGVKQ